MPIAYHDWCLLALPACVRNVLETRRLGKELAETGRKGHVRHLIITLIPLAQLDTPSTLSFSSSRVLSPPRLHMSSTLPSREVSISHLPPMRTPSSPIPGMTIAVYVGMLTGALFWGLTADIIGRKFAFNFSLLICSIFAIVAGASPNWYVLGLFVCLSAFGGGGNLVLDTAVFLEYLPSKNQWLVTLMAAWWGLGQLVAGLFAWAFLPNYSCDSVETCTYENNKGWRYVWYANGALVFVMSIARITVIKLRETPKFLIGEGKDEQVIETLQFIANKYNRPCSLTLERLQACGVTGAANGIGYVLVMLCKHSICLPPAPLGPALAEDSLTPLQPRRPRQIPLLL